MKINNGIPKMEDEEMNMKSRNGVDGQEGAVDGNLEVKSEVNDRNQHYKMILIAFLALFLCYRLNSLFSSHSLSPPQNTINQQSVPSTAQIKIQQPHKSISELPVQQDTNQNQKPKPQSFEQKQLLREKIDTTLPEQEYYGKMLQIIDPRRAQHLDLKTPELYLDIFKIKKSKELPFCLVMRNMNSFIQFQQIIDSIKATNYSNIYVTYSGKEELYSDGLKAIFNTIDVVKRKQIFAIKNMVDANCPKQSIIVPIKSKIRQDFLYRLNILYQRQNIWLTYESHSEKEYSSVSSFYSKLLQEITYDKIGKQAPQIHSQQLLKFAYSMIYLAKYHSETFPIKWIYEQIPAIEGLSSFKGRITSRIKPYSITPLMYFQRNHQTEAQVTNFLKKLNTTTPPENKYKPRNDITLPMMLKSLEYYSLKDFPKNHTLFQRQIYQYQEKYQISKYPQQLPICAIVLTRNNIEWNRYKKVLQTIKMQNYSNYHIVFIDDASTDQTFEESSQYMRQIHLSGRSELIKNQKQMYATYNIQNAVHNYCESKQIAVLIDGDDQLIGRQVFKLVNFGYQESKNWIVYFSFFSTIYMYGVSQIPKPQFFTQNQQRKQMKVIGALRTFYVDLYRKIEMKDHKDDDGDFFDRLYDDAMQHPLLEMAGIQHTRYIPQVVYFYNQDYGRNDGATQEGRQDWKKHERQVISRPKYQRLQNL